MGEPSKTTRLLHVKMTSEEYSAACAKANRLGLSIDDAARLALLEWISESGAALASPTGGQGQGALIPLRVPMLPRHSHPPRPGIEDEFWARTELMMDDDGLVRGYNICNDLYEVAPGHLQQRLQRFFP